MRTRTFAMLLSLLVGASNGFAQPARPADPPGTVTLAIPEYNRLIDLARQPVTPTIVPPVSAVLSSAQLRIRVERDTVRGVFDLAGDVLREGVSRVHLLSGATLVDAHAGGQPVPVVADGANHSALLSGPGPFSLTLEWGAPLVFAPGRASFVLPVPASGTARATFDLPGDQADVRLSAGLITSRSTSDGRTIVDATLEPGSATQVSWSMRDSAPVAAAREVRTLGDIFTLITIDESDVRMVSLADVTVVQGEPRSIAVRLPAGYELASVSGSTVETSEARDGTLTLTLTDPSVRRHQILMSFERSHQGGSFELTTAVPALVDVGRERGEIAIEGVGTLELAAEERDNLHRIDVKELNPALQSLARLPILSAFRYQGTAPDLALDIKRFDDAGVLAAVADRAAVTTLVTAEGRVLTEIILTVQNRAQPFLRVSLPSGASIVSVEIEGQTTKPVLGTDGVRVPLLRPGFRPNGPYTVSFVYLHGGTPFGRKGDIQLALPQIDIPVGIVEWEMFMPGNYSARVIGGNAIDRHSRAMLAAIGAEHENQATYRIAGGGAGVGSGIGAGRGGSINTTIVDANSARVAFGGLITDMSGAPLPGVSVELKAGTRSVFAVSGADGRYVLPTVLSGPAEMRASLAGFPTQSRTVSDAARPQRVDFVMALGGVSETVTATGNSPAVDTQFSQVAGTKEKVQAQPSQNVLNLQRRAAGVLPVRVDIPRAGTSHRFVRPLVVGEETTVTLRYKRK